MIHGNPERIRQALRGIGGGFTWDSTPQGSAYWNGVYTALNELLGIAQEEQAAQPNSGERE